MHEDFQLHIRAFLADFFDFVQAQFARQNNAFHAHFLPKFHRHIVHGVGLHGKVDWHIRIIAFVHALAYHHDETGVGHDETIGFHRNDGFNIAQISANLVVMRQQIAGDKEFFATFMRFTNARFDLFELKFVVTRPQTVARLPRIHGICAKIVSGSHFVQRASGEEKFR